MGHWDKVIAGFFRYRDWPDNKSSTWINQLRAFVERRRPNPIMSNVARMSSAQT